MNSRGHVHCMRHLRGNAHLLEHGPLVFEWNVIVRLFQAVNKSIQRSKWRVLVDQQKVVAWVTFVADSKEANQRERMVRAQEL